jgi:hypothetical protein
MRFFLSVLVYPSIVIFFWPLSSSIVEHILIL